MKILFLQLCWKKVLAGIWTETYFKGVYICGCIFSRYSLGSSRPRVFCKKGVLKNFAKITGKHLCQSLFFNEVADMRPATSLKKRLWHRYSPVNFAKFLRTALFKEHIWWLLLFAFTDMLLSLLEELKIDTFFLLHFSLYCDI